jgi:hypothetical protein
MKPSFKYILILLGAVCLLTRVTVQAQTIRIFYYAPTATMNTNFTGPTAAYIHADACQGTNTGYSYVVLDNQTAPIFRNIAPPTIKKTYDSLTNASSLLRRRLMQIRELSNGVVNEIEMHLFDDRTGLIASDTCKCDEVFGTQRGVCLGYVYLGETSANHIISTVAGAWWAWYETVVHEFSHTQFAMEYDAAGRAVPNKWGNNGIAISYGGDAGHWGSEIQADPQSSGALNATLRAELNF